MKPGPVLGSGLVLVLGSKPVLVLGLGLEPVLMLGLVLINVFV